MELSMNDNSIRVGSAVLIVRDNKLLLGRRNKQPDFGRWILPGGKIEYGETHEEAAIREAKEELGLTIEVVRLAGKGVYHILPPDRHRIIIYSIATIIDGIITPSSDISEASFFTKDELKKLDITDVVRKVLFDSDWL